MYVCKGILQVITTTMLGQLQRLFVSINLNQHWGKKTGVAKIGQMLHTVPQIYCCSFQSEADKWPNLYLSKLIC